MLAKKLKAQGYGRHDLLANQILHWLGYKNFHELNSKVTEEQSSNTLAVLTSVVSILETPRNTSIAYRLRIDGSAWHLLVAKNGPELHLEYRPSGGREFEHQVRTTQLGLFPVLIKTNEFFPNTQKNAEKEWVLTRYGTYPTLALDFLSDQAAEELSQHFGIPVQKKGPPIRNQQAESEMLFLCSPAFRALRQAFRTGTIPLPGNSDWRSGLCSLWSHFVAASDSDFSKVRYISETYLKSGIDPTHSLSALDLKLRELWELIPTLGESKDGLDYGFTELVESWQKTKRGGSKSRQTFTLQGVHSTTH